MAQVKQIATESAFVEHTSSLSSSALQIIYFHAPWAAVCQQVASVLEALAGTYPASNPSSISFISVNAEEVPSIAEKHEVTAVPFISLQRHGKTLDTVSGADATNIRAAIEKYAGVSTSGTTSSLPPAQSVNKPAGETVPSPSSAVNGGTVTKDLSGYAPGENGNTRTPETDKAALWQRLETLVKAAPVMLFMKGTPSAPQCGFSRQTVGLLRERSIRYGFFNILADDDVRQGLKEFSEWPTYPQLYVSGELVGGLDIIKEQFAEDPEFLLEYSVNSQKPAAPSQAESQAA